MPRLMWKHPDERYTCYSQDGKTFYGAYWRNTREYIAHIIWYDWIWYKRIFPLETSEKEVRREIQRFINHFKEEKDKWERE